MYKKTTGRMFFAIVFLTAASNLFGMDGSKKGSIQLKDNFAPAFSNERNGQYVHYHITHDENDVIISMMKLSNQTLGCRMYNIQSRRETNADFNFFLSKAGQYIFEPASYRGNPSEEELELLLGYITGIVYISSGIPDIPLEKHALITREDPNTGITYYHAFARWIPFFGLLSSKSSEPSGLSIELAALGWCNPETSDIKKVFFIEELPHGKTGESFDIIKSKEVTVTLSGISFIIDENWAFKGKQPEAGLPHETYWIEREGIRFAQIGVESLGSGHINGFTASLELLIQLQECVFANAVIIENKEDSTRVSFSNIDPATGLENYVYHEFFDLPNGEKRVVSFSCLKSIYDRNDAYFYYILDSLKLAD